MGGRAHEGWSNTRKREVGEGRGNERERARPREREREKGRGIGNERGSGLCFAERGINRGSLAPTDTIGTF